MMLIIRDVTMHREPIKKISRNAETTIDWSSLGIDLKNNNCNAS